MNALGIYGFGINLLAIRCSASFEQSGSILSRVKCDSPMNTVNFVKVIGRQTGMAHVPFVGMSEHIQLSVASGSECDLLTGLSVRIQIIRRFSIGCFENLIAQDTSSV